MRIDFDIELAKEIFDGKVEGKIVTRDGRGVTIERWRHPVDPTSTSVIAGKIHGTNYIFGCEHWYRDGRRFKNQTTDGDLFLEVSKIPTITRTESNFSPPTIFDIELAEEAEKLGIGRVITRKGLDVEILSWDFKQGDQRVLVGKVLGDGLGCGVGIFIWSSEGKSLYNNTEEEYDLFIEELV